MKQQRQESNITVENKVDRFAFHLIPKESRDIPIITEKEVNGKDYLYYGEDNMMPQYLWNLYLKSAVMQGIVNGTIDYASGNEVKCLKSVINNEGDTIDDIIRKVVTDYMIYGGFALQVLRNYNNQVSEIYWMDVKDLRLDKEGNYIYYSKNWGKYGSKAIKYERFDPKKIQSNSVFYYNGHLSRGVYPIPRYVGALAAIETSTEIGKFHLNNILNNLTSSAVVNFNNGVPSKEEQKDIEKRLKDKFSGADNAGKFMVSFNDSKENAVTVERLAEDKMDEKFQTLSKSTMQEIFIAFRATPELFGMSTEGNGFSLAEFEEAFKLYNKTVVKPIQNDVKRCFEKLGIEVDFIPFKLDAE